MGACARSVKFPLPWHLRMDVQDQLLRAKFEDLDGAPATTKDEPDEFDVQADTVSDVLAPSPGSGDLCRSPHTYILPCCVIIDLSSLLFLWGNSINTCTHFTCTVYPQFSCTRLSFCAVFHLIIYSSNYSLPHLPVHQWNSATVSCGPNGINSTDTSLLVAPGTPPHGAEITSPRWVCVVSSVCVVLAS